MNAELNPYCPPLDVSPTTDSFEQQFSNSVTIVGLLLGTIASLGAIGRCFVEFESLVIWPNCSRVSPLAVAYGVLAIVALGVANWLLLALMSNIHRFVTKDYVAFCKSLLLIASVAMIARLVSEPSVNWTPTWPSYLLTFSGTTALVMVSYRIRMQTADEIYVADQAVPNIPVRHVYA